MKNKSILFIILIICTLFLTSTVYAGIFEFAEDTEGMTDDLDNTDYDSNYLKEDSETVDFGFFKIDVPNDVTFEATGTKSDEGLLAILYSNNNSNTYDDVMTLDAWFVDDYQNLPEIGPEFELFKTKNDMKIYIDTTADEKTYWVIKDFNQSSFGIMGQDLKTIEKMINSIKVIGVDIYEGYGHFDDNDNLIYDDNPTYMGSYG